MTDHDTDWKVRANRTDWKSRANRNVRPIPTPPRAATATTTEPEATEGPEATGRPGGGGAVAEPGRGSWADVLRGTARRAATDKLTTWAAALTYYSILSIFPGLLVLVSALRLAGMDTMNKVLADITSTAPGPAKTVLTSALNNLQRGAAATAGIAAFIGVLAALWSASSYVGSFMEAADSINDESQTRPAWKKLPIRLGLTIVAGLIVAASALAVVLTGGFARQVGDLIGLGPAAVKVWDVAKWPVLVILISLLFALLYWASPSTRRGRFRPVTAGSLLATLIWIVASGLFGLYVSMFGSYNKTYGSLAAVIIFLIWLWISNLAILLGAEFDAERRRVRATPLGAATRGRTRTGAHGRRSVTG